MPSSATDKKRLMVELEYFGLQPTQKVILPKSVRVLVLTVIYELLQFGNSTILSSEQQQQQLNDWYGNRDQKWELIYKATRDSFRAAVFHQVYLHYHHRMLTIYRNAMLKELQSLSFKPITTFLEVSFYCTVVELNGIISTGYNSDSWSSTDSYFNPSGCWLFSLTNPSNTPIKIPSNNNGQSVHGGTKYGPVFGGGNDLCEYFLDNLVA